MIATLTTSQNPDWKETLARSTEFDKPHRAAIGSSSWDGHREYSAWPRQACPVHRCSLPRTSRKIIARSAFGLQCDLSPLPLHLRLLFTASFRRPLLCGLSLLWVLLFFSFPFFFFFFFSDLTMNMRFSFPSCYRSLFFYGCL